MKLELNIVFNDGNIEPVAIQASDWRRWEIETKQKMTNTDLGMSDLLYLAHASIKRSAGKPIKPLDAWCDTVADVEVVTANANPTSAVASDD